MTSLSDVADALAAAERTLERRVGAAKALVDQGNRAQAQAAQAKAEEVACEEAVAFLNSFADERQAKVQQRIEALVTHGIQSIFGEDLTFHVNSEQKSNRAEVTFTLRSQMDGVVVETPILDARGGGVAAVAGFLLRLVITLLRKDRPVLVLDETWAHLSADYEPRLAEFVKEMTEQTGVQILLVTHSDAYTEHADKVYRFSQKDGRTAIESVDTSS